MAEWMVAADMEINIPGDSTAVGSEIDAAPCRSEEPSLSQPSGGFFVPAGSRWRAISF
jgi:hypothetical protein